MKLFSLPVYRVLVLLFIPLFLCPTAHSAPPSGYLFENEDILKIKIEANFKDLLKDRTEERPYFPARLSYTSTEGETVSIEKLKIKLRGNFRRKRATCGFPPIRLNFAKKGTEETIFEGQDKLKLVTHCQSKKKLFEQYLFQEYLIYKTYNLVTDKSFRVRLAEITYIDSAQKYDPLTKYGFLIEDQEALAQRLGCEVYEQENVHPNATQTSNTVAMFNYMIGNTDWSIPGLHNVKLIKESEFGAPICVPYDFDWSGLISAPYAVPSEKLGIPNVQTRLYRGFCIGEAEFNTLFDHFLSKQSAILDLFTNFELLDEKTRKKSVGYLESFFGIISNPKRRKNEIMGNCRK